MRDLKIRLIKNSSEYNEIVKIRTVVFVKEQKVPRDIEMDEHECGSKHIVGGSGYKYIIAFYRGKPMGCGRLRFTEGKAKLERIAVLKRHRGKAKLERIAVLKRYRNRGFGKQILEYMVRYAKRKKPGQIYMHAQYYLKDYYKKLGFRPAGKIFYEAGIRHVKMCLVDKL